MGSVAAFPRDHRHASMTVRGSAPVVQLPDLRKPHVRLIYDFAWLSYRADVIGAGGAKICTKGRTDRGETLAIAEQYAASFSFPLYDLTSEGARS